MPAALQTSSKLELRSCAAQFTTFRAAWPIKLIVSSTRPAPSRGLESTAIRSDFGIFFASKPLLGNRSPLGLRWGGSAQSVRP